MLLTLQNHRGFLEQGALIDAVIQAQKKDGYTLQQFESSRKTAEVYGGGDVSEALSKLQRIWEVQLL